MFRIGAQPTASRVPVFTLTRIFCYNIRMKTKLTLSIDKELVQVARHEAQSDGKSISGMFSEFLLARKSRAARQAIPKVSEMVGSLKRYNINDSKTAIRVAYAKKHSN